MKLLNCTTLRIEESLDSSAPKPYAILSHRWEADEVTYQDVVGTQAPAHKAGWTKIREACRVALSMGYEYAWVDTCCIDKQNLTELTEAINSMFKWYANAAVCLAYLSDISPGESSIENSLWFTRGWTLQELIAPRVVEFFDKKWNPIGTRAGRCDEIHLHTRIDKEILRHQASSGRTVEGLLSEVPLARRMSWASERTTTREEDIAYSLLGIFGINMPLLYGEGNNAFMRLQMEIMKETNDMTLFAWTCCPTNPYQQGPPQYRGILATSPAEFEGVDNVILSRDIKYNPEYTMTNKGLRIVTEIVVDEDITHYLMLGCTWEGAAPGKSLGIPLKDHGGGVFLRSHPDRLVLLGDKMQTKRATLYIKKHIQTQESPPVYAETQQVFRKAYQFHTTGPRKMTIERAVPGSRWSKQKNMFITEGLDSFDGFVEFRLPDAGTGYQSFIVACGFASSGNEWICMASSNDENRLVYNSAINGDLNRMRKHAMKAKQVWNSQTTTTMGSEAEATVRTRLRKTEPIFDIYVEVITQCLIM